MDVKKATTKLDGKKWTENNPLKKLDGKNWTGNFRLKKLDGKNWTDFFRLKKLDGQKLDGKFPTKKIGRKKLDVPIQHLIVADDIPKRDFFVTADFSKRDSAVTADIHKRDFVTTDVPVQNLRVYYFCPCYGFAWIICKSVTDVKRRCANGLSNGGGRGARERKNPLRACPLAVQAAGNKHLSGAKRESW